MTLPASIPAIPRLLFYSLAALTIGSFSLAFLTEEYILLGVPFAALLGWVAVVNFRSLYFLLLFLLPLSTEVEVGSFGTDLPAEPLMAGLMLVGLLFFPLHMRKLDWSLLRQPLFILLVLHLFWIGIATLNSVDPFISIKYLLAKGWYVITFFGLTLLTINNLEDFKRFFWTIFWPLAFTMCYTLLRHGMLGFSFDDVNKPMVPFFRNHVDYAAMLAVFYPLIWVAAGWYKRGSFRRRVLQMSKLLFAVAIYLSFTRACILALAVAAALYMIVRWKLLRPLMLGSTMLILVVAVFLVQENRFMDFAPTFEKTVHHDEFDQHIEATLAMEDASSMERFYRWIAAGYMANERPLTGYGPGNFFPYYKGYTVYSFRTYLSDNDEGSTVHNYFLLMLVEQGWIGLIIFSLFTIAIFFYGQKVIDRAKDPKIKSVMIGLLLSISVIYVNLIFSDLIESVKVGTLFFAELAILLQFGQLNDRNELAEAAGE